MDATRYRSIFLASEETFLGDLLLDNLCFYLSQIPFWVLLSYLVIEVILTRYIKSGSILCDSGLKRVVGADDGYDGARHQESYRSSDHPGACDLLCVAKIYPNYTVMKIPLNIDREWNVFNLLKFRLETSRSSLRPCLSSFCSLLTSSNYLLHDHWSSWPIKLWL